MARSKSPSTPSGVTTTLQVAGREGEGVKPLIEEVFIAIGQVFTGCIHVEINT